MTENEWAFPVALQPQADLVSFDLPAALASVVRVRGEVPGQAFTASPLGTDRLSSGVAVRVAGQLLIITMGYVLLEAEQVWITTHVGVTHPAHALAFDEATGLGLVLPLGQLDLPSLSFGNSSALDHHSELWIIGYGGVAHCSAAQLQQRRSFAGFWEFLLEEGLMVSPLHPEFSGTALLDSSGKLVGIGALALHDPSGNARHNANLFVPAAPLPAMIQHALNTGRAQPHSRPWLGIYAADQDNGVTVMEVARHAPAALAKLRRGDVITEVADDAVTDLEGFYRLLWQHQAGSVIALTIKRKGRLRRVSLTATSREAFFYKPVRH